MSNYAVYFALEKKLHGQGFDFERSEAVNQFTNGRKTGLRQLTPEEYREFINWLNTQAILHQTKNHIKNTADQQMRRKIISLLAKIGFVKNDKADMSRIYSWVLSHGYLGKTLNAYTASELPKLVYQAEEFYKSHIERL